MKIMKMECGKLLSVVKRVGQVIKGDKQALPILSSVRVEVSERNVSVHATNLDQYLKEVTAHGGAEEVFNICVSYRKLLAILGSLEQREDVELSCTDKKLTIKSGRSKFVLVTISADEFPEVPQAFINGQKVVSDTTVIPEDFSRAIRSVQVAQSFDSTRPVLCSVYFDRDSICATDGKRLHVNKVDCKFLPDDAAGVVIPTELVSIISGWPGFELVRFVNGEDQIHLHSEAEENSLWVWCKKVEGKYPDFKSVIPDFKGPQFVAIEINSTGFREAVSRAALMCDDKNPAVTIEFNEKGGSIRAEYETGDSREELVYRSAVKRKVKMNPRFVIDALNQCDDDRSSFIHLCADGLSPVVVTQGDFQAVIMPLRAAGE